MSDRKAALERIKAIREQYERERVANLPYPNHLLRHFGKINVNSFHVTNVNPFHVTDVNPFHVTNVNPLHVTNVNPFHVTDVTPGSNIYMSGRGIVNMAWSREDVLPMPLSRPPVGGVEELDIVTYTGTTTFENRPESCAEQAAQRAEVARQTQSALDEAARLLKEVERLRRRVAMPPGMWMSRIARSVFFFSPKTVERVFEEGIADYRDEMIKLEARRASAAELRTLRVQHWGGFVLALFEEIWNGTVGRLYRALTNG